MRNAYILVGKLEERYHLEDLNIEGKIILNGFKKDGRCGLDSFCSG
jgi:hypothetical protein